MHARLIASSCNQSDAKSFVFRCNGYVLLLSFKVYVLIIVFLCITENFYESKSIYGIARWFLYMRSTSRVVGPRHIFKILKRK